VHLRVDLPDGRYTLVLEGGDRGVDEDLQYVVRTRSVLVVDG
jgi:hypothetical protein